MDNWKGRKNNMFNFRIIETVDGNQIIDRNIKTPYNALTPLKMMEYMEMDIQLSIIDKIEKKIRREAEIKRKLARNPLWKIACFCGLV